MCPAWSGPCVGIQDCPAQNPYPVWFPSGLTIINRCLRTEARKAPDGRRESTNRHAKEQGRTHLLYRYYCMIKHGALHTRDARCPCCCCCCTRCACMKISRGCQSTADAPFYTFALLPSRQREGITSAHISHSCFVTWFVCVYTHIYTEKKTESGGVHLIADPFLMSLTWTGRCGQTASQRRA